MKNLLLAAIIAVSGVASLSPPAEAASVTITTDNNRIDMRRHRDRDRDRDRDSWHHRRHDRQHCHVRVTKKWRHHRVVITKERVCD